MMWAFGITAFESMVVAIVIKGPWFILLVPGLACAARARELWRERAADRPG